MEVSKLSIVSYYNRHMGGVDRIDQNVLYYRITVQSKVVDDIYYFHAGRSWTKFLVITLKEEQKELRLAEILQENCKH